MKTLLAIAVLVLLSAASLPLLGVAAFNSPPPRGGSKPTQVLAGTKQPRRAIDDKPAAQVTFATIDITIDPLGRPLGAYQFELTSADASFTVVGVEAGDHPAFDHGRPPYFDRVAMEQDTDKLIVAEYAAPGIERAVLPTQAVHVATVHVLFAGGFDAKHPPTIVLTLTAAGDADGNRIDAETSHALRFAERPE